MKKALITGVTGQDGSYLSEYLRCLESCISIKILKHTGNTFGQLCHSTFLKVFAHTVNTLHIDGIMSG